MARNLNWSHLSYTVNRQTTITNIVTSRDKAHVTIAVRYYMPPSLDHAWSNDSQIWWRDRPHITTLHKLLVSKVRRSMVNKEQ